MNPLLLLLPLAASLPAQAIGDNPTDDLRRDVARSISANVRSASLTGNKLEGDGAAWLLDRARGAAFVVLGESHGNAETCAVTSWLLRDLAQRGFDAYATETGPCTTEHLAGIAAARGAAGVFEFIRAQPFSIAFLHMQQESELFAEAVSLGYQPWGLDQEFMGSARFLLGQLAARAQHAEARTLAEQWQRRARDGFAHFAQTGDRSRAFMAVADADDWRALQAAFAGESDAVRELLEELRVSQRIYGHFHAGRFYRNNLERIELMKAHFAQRLRAKPAAKVVLKLGAAHAGRGYSPFDQLDVGNHAAELAVARGGRSLHVLICARRSVHEDGSRSDLTADAGGMAAFFAAIPNEPDDSAARVYDLASLRPVFSAPEIKAAFPETHSLVLRFDALLILPEFHSSTPLHALPKRR